MIEDKYCLDEHGLRTENVGNWATAKYELVSYYTDMFTTSMRGKWGNLVYVDLFAGPGAARLESGQLVDSSAGIALRLRRPFSRYIFCDIDPINIETLARRVQCFFADRDAHFVVGDANEQIDQVIQALPAVGPGNKTMLAFCLLDPYNMRSLRFRTVQRLARYFIDFLVLVPSFMDANRDRAAYERSGNRVVEEFVGSPEWRRSWAQLEARRGVGAFGRFVTNQFVESMKKLGFSLGARRIVRFEHRTKLYHLLGFSRSQRGLDFWREAERRTDPVRRSGQGFLFEEDN